jgi:uncharacterized protein (TIGR01777 family)
MKRKLLIAGGTGLIGSALKIAAQEEGWEVDILSRTPGKGHIVWDPSKGLIDLDQETNYDAIINLAGASIAGGRWTSARKQDILSSRIDACHTIAAKLRSGQLKTDVYIGTSAIGIYGDREDELIDDHSPPGPDDNWMAHVAKQWEQAHEEIMPLGSRTVILRVGIVLSEKGGALKELLSTAPAGIIGYFGNGQQYWPWIHIDDVVQIILHAVTHSNTQHHYLTVAPHAVTSKALSHVIAKELHKMAVPVPGLVLNVMMGEMRQMLLQSCKAYPGKLLAEGYTFRFNRIEEALKDLLRKEE